MNKSHFLKKAVIITGASSRIGRELALKLAEQRAWLALAARNARGWKKLQPNVASVVVKP
jgi:short-subunit dehydrogenase